MSDSVSDVLVIAFAIGFWPAILIGWIVLLCRASTDEERERRLRLTLPLQEQEALAQADRIAYHRMVEETYPLRAQSQGWYPFDK